jgi:tryptophan 2,3-dioxygenase
VANAARPLPQPRSLPAQQAVIEASGTIPFMSERNFDAAAPPLAVSGTGLTYSSYLRLDALLSLQELRSRPPEHDEMLFIVIHQIYELWFKQVLHELGRLEEGFATAQVPVVLGTFKRILTIFKTLVTQVDVLETMTPTEFGSFRARLESASGFQSLQFRLIEIRLGKRDPRVIAHFGADPEVRRQLDGLLAEPSLYEQFLRFLGQEGVAVAQDPRAALIDVYRHRPELVAVCERMVDLDEGVQEWRYRHVKMVERTIGLRRGTGGSAGAEYLRTTLFQPLFPDLWAIRGEL